MNNTRSCRPLKKTASEALLIIAVVSAVFFFAMTINAAAEDQSPALTVKVDGEIAKTYETVEDILAVEDVLTGPLEFTGYNTYPTMKSESVEEALNVSVIIKDAAGKEATEFGENACVAFDAYNYRSAFTIKQMFGTKRFFFPHIAEGNDKPGRKSPQSAYRDAAAVPVVITLAEDPGDAQIMYGQSAPNEQNWSGFVSGMLDGGLIEITAEAAPKCDSVTWAKPANGSIVANGTQIRLPLPETVADRRTKTHYILDPAGGEIPGEGDDLYFYSPYRWSSDQEKNERYINPPVIYGAGVHTLAVRVSAYGKQDSDVTYFKYIVLPDAPKAPTVKLSAGKKKITVKWKKVSGASGYVIYRSVKKKSGFKAVKTIKKGSTVKYTGKKLKKGKKYYFKVRAFAEAGGARVFSKYSAVKSARAK